MKHKKQKAVVIKDERRIAQRMPVTFRIHFRTTSSKKWERAICQDISGSGVRLLTDDKLRRRSTIVLRITDRRFSEMAVILQCKVVWTGMTIAENFVSGLNFHNIDKQREFILGICAQLLESRIV
ncbi:PilZ domain-containing protein [Candidatus Omnitrophota bacterium]